MEKEASPYLPSRQWKRREQMLADPEILAIIGSYTVALTKEAALDMLVEIRRCIHTLDVAILSEIEFRKSGQTISQIQKNPKGAVTP